MRYNDRMKESPQTQDTLVTRRDFLKGFAALGGSVAFESMVIPPALAEQFERGATRRFQMRAGTAYDKDTIDRTLKDSSKKAGDLTPDELQNLAGFAQRLYADISGGGTIQSKLLQHFPHINENIELVITEGKSFVQSGEARFGHVPRNEGLSQLYISADRDATSLPLSALHELTHAAYGVGEVRAQSVTVLGGLHAMAQQLVDVEALAQSEDLFAFWLKDFRYAFYSRRMREIEAIKPSRSDLRYRYLPMLLFGGLRDARLAKKPLDAFKAIENIGSAMEQRLESAFMERMQNSTGPLVALEHIMLLYMYECAHMIRDYNPSAELPSALRKYGNQKQ